MKHKYFIAILDKADRLIEESKDLKDYRKKLIILDKNERKRILKKLLQSKK